MIDESMSERLGVLDPDMRAVVEVLAGSPALRSVGAVAARAARAAARASLTRPLEEVASIEHRMVELSGRSIEVRIYRPQGGGVRPGFVYLHGGGWVLGTLEDCEPLCRQLANRLGAVVFAVDYRLAPEHRYPAALDDAYDAWRHVIDSSAELGIDETRVVVGGDSAGGNLAAAICLRAAGRGVAMPAAQLLVYPVTEVYEDAARFDEALALPPLSVDSMLWFGEQYLESPGEAKLAEVSPLLAPDLSAMPPAVVVTARHDILRPQVEAYARRLDEAGVPVRVLAYEGVVHGFFGQAPLVARASEAVDTATAALLELLGG